MKHLLFLPRRPGARTAGWLLISCAIAVAREVVQAPTTWRFTTSFEF